MTELTVADLGIASEQTSTLSADQAERLAATLDTKPATDTVPLLWHWAFFNAAIPTAELGDDGHPVRSSALLQDFPRRMWVGGALKHHAPLRLGQPASLVTKVLRHELKHGSTGDLLLVTLEHVVRQGGATAVTERQDVIYRQAGAGTSPLEDVSHEGPPVPDSETVRPSTALLFRFSAVTFNSHRIHYDHGYATAVEHYPALVVHGPLTAMLLAKSAVRRLGRPLQSFAFRASAPLFVDQPIVIEGNVESTPTSTATMTARRVDGTVAMTATAQ